MREEQVVVPNGSVVLHDVDLRDAGNLGMASSRLTYLGGQVPENMLPLTVACDWPRSPSNSEIVLKYLLPGEYRFEFKAPNWGRRIVTFRIQRGEQMRMSWPNGR